jgi:Tfp pilus assembly protein PilO
MKLGLREILFLTVMVALLVCTYLFVFEKANRKREALVKETQERQQTLESLRQATAGIDDLNRKISDLQEAIKFFESKLPQEKEIDNVLQEVSQKAEQNSLSTKTFKSLKVERNANYSEQAIQMTLSGDFRGFYSFLQQIEKLQRITRLTDMKLEKINDRNGEMQAQVTLSIFFTPDPNGSAVATTGN